jgi:hypothetical protein
VPQQFAFLVPTRKLERKMRLELQPVSSYSEPGD